MVRVNLRHACRRHASGDAGGLEVRVEPWLEKQIQEPLAELGCMSSPRREERRLGARLKALPTLGAQEEQPGGAGG